MEKKLLETQIKDLTELRQQLFDQVIELDDRVLFQDFGVYQPQYKFATVDEYKEKLHNIREKQKMLIKQNKAAIAKISWIVQGSEAEGKKLNALNIKQALRNFNIECDLCISKVKFSNYDNSRERILKAFEYGYNSR